MEILVRNFPDQITETQIRQFLRPFLEKLNINTFNCRKLKTGGCATITIADVLKAQNLLNLHGQIAPGPARVVRNKLYYMNRHISCVKSHNNPPDRFLIQGLEKDERERLSAVTNGRSKTARAPLKRKFETSSLDCGQWGYLNGRLTFMSHFREHRNGLMMFGRRALIVDLSPLARLPGQRLEIPHYTVESFIIGNPANPEITLSLWEAPKLFENIPEDVTSGLINLTFARHRKPTIKRKRVSAIEKAHEGIVSSCMCYRFRLQDSSDLSSLQALRRVTHIPQSMRWDTSNILKGDFLAQLAHLQRALAGNFFDKISFEVKFQFQRLAQNGFLPPATVFELLQRVARDMSRVHDTIMIDSVRKLASGIPYPGPLVDASDLSVDSLIDLLAQSQEHLQRESLYSPDFFKQYEHIALVHKAMVTPTGIYLSGPESEVKNRVLRKYSEFSSYFLQVSFLDEDLEALRFSSAASNEDIYNRRFKQALEGVINIAGRGYEVDAPDPV